MNKLWNIVVAMLATTLVFSAAGIAFASYQMWPIALTMLFATIIEQGISRLAVLERRAEFASSV